MHDLEEIAKAIESIEPEHQPSPEWEAGFAAALKCAARAVRTINAMAAPRIALDRSSPQENLSA